MTQHDIESSLMAMLSDVYGPSVVISHSGGKYHLIDSKSGASESIQDDLYGKHGLRTLWLLNSILGQPMDDIELDGYNVEELLSWRRDLLRRHAIQIIDEVRDCFTSRRYADVGNYLGWSPAGDGMGSTTSFVSFEDVLRVHPSVVGRTSREASWIHGKSVDADEPCVTHVISLLMS